MSNQYSIQFAETKNGNIVKCELDDKTVFLMSSNGLTIMLPDNFFKNQEKKKIGHKEFTIFPNEIQLFIDMLSIFNMMESGFKNEKILEILDSRKDLIKKQIKKEKQKSMMNQLIEEIELPTECVKNEEQQNNKGEKK